MYQLIERREYAACNKALEKPVPEMHENFANIQNMIESIPVITPV